MALPFTVEEFFGVFERYNLAVWPMQWVLYLVSIIAVVLALLKWLWANRIISLILAFFWLWMGIAYQLAFFTTINQAAFFFGLMFILQAVLLLHAGVLKDRLSFGKHQGITWIVGAMLMIYAMLVYPAVASLSGHHYPRTPTFGLPCPTTIFTFGLLLWTNQRVPRYLLVIPVIWSAIGTFAALLLGVREDFGLPVAGLLGSLLLWMRDRKLQHPNIKRFQRTG